MITTLPRPMNAPRKNKVITGPTSDAMDGWVGVLRRQLNNILTAILVIAAIAMFVRWRLKTAEMNKQAVGSDLAGARAMVLRLRNAYPGGSPADWMKAVQSLELQANASISNVLNNSDAAAGLRGEAFVLRGDLYWHLANLPELPGSASEPNLRLTETPELLLQKSFEAYSEVVKNSTYTEQYESLDAAHLGLGAIAENRGDWKTAISEFQAVVNNPNSLDVLSDQARFQLAQLPDLQKSLYIAPPNGTGPATMPIAGEFLSPIGSTMPLGSPTTFPTTAAIGATIQSAGSATTTRALK